jgi:hypothetical protein
LAKPEHRASHVPTPATPLAADLGEGLALPNDVASAVASRSTAGCCESTAVKLEPLRRVNPVRRGLGAGRVADDMESNVLVGIFRARPTRRLED